MTPLISARRAAEDFARVVDGEKVGTADRYADLTSYVELLRAQDIPAARTEFVADLRSQLMTAADTLLVAAEPAPAKVVQLAPAARRHHRRLATAAAAFVLVGGTAGVAAAAEQSLPGDPLYPLKRSIESAQVTLNTSDAAKGHDLINQAGTRLDEVNALMSNGDSTTQIQHTLASFQRSAASGADLLFVAYQRGGNPEDLASLRAVFSRQAGQLQDLARLAPPTTQPDFAAASSLLAGLDQQARVLCGNCGPDSGNGLDLTSAPSLENLLTAPVTAAAADQARSEAQQLAQKAGQIAKNTPKAPTVTPGGSTPPPAGSSGGGILVPPLSGGSGSTITSTVTGTVKTVTGGVQGLLDEVGTTTGLTPVTDTVNNTLDGVTNLLTGGK